MRDYSNGKIYCIRSPHTDKVYIGSTINKLNDRMYKHNSNYKIFKIKKGQYYNSFEILKYGDCFIELIKLYPCCSSKELLREEGKYIIETKCVNKNIAGRTKQEWTKEKGNEYYQKNKQKLNEQAKSRYHKNKQKINEQSRARYHKNKEKINEQARARYHKNKANKQKK